MKAEAERHALENTVAKYYNRIGINNDNFIIISPNFSICGVCQHQMVLRGRKVMEAPVEHIPDNGSVGEDDRGSHGRRRGRGHERSMTAVPSKSRKSGEQIELFSARQLYCSVCNSVHSLPTRGVLLPREENCLICGFQVLNVKNTDTNKEHTVCPHCFK